ncbi:MAG: dehydrogenase E1 component subunit alpha/beta [Planctomycetes bacterium]|nr:dehydrogenase E1 component subunit alpha/beta [Planctomycetota bacterium]
MTDESRSREPSSAAGLTPEAAGLLETHFHMRLSREWDQRFEKLFRQGGVAKWYSGVGSEATTVASAACLRRDDALLTIHRDSGAILRYYASCEDLVPGLLPVENRHGREKSRELLYRLACQLLGRSDGFTAGYDRSFHYAHLDEETGLKHIGMISHMGAMIPVAAGVALAFRQQGSDRVALNYIGDGGTSTGEFHEGLNMAAVLDAPLVLVILNNRYAFSTPTSEQYRAESLATRAEGYGIEGIRIDGNDPLAVSAAVSGAVERARGGGGPTLIEAMLGRMRGHSEGDDSLGILDEAEKEKYESEDPVACLEASLVEQGIATTEHIEKVRGICAELVLEIVDEAAASAAPKLAGGERPVFARATGSPGKGPLARGLAGSAEETSYLEAISLALGDAMEEDPEVFLMGQDIAAFGGAFKVTRGLLEEFGPGRVLNTPIAEAGMIGIASGAALLGKRPVVEMQFSDFVSCGFNPLVNVAARFHYRTGLPVPLVIRLPSGGGVGAGPFHSQSLEATFLHVPGLKVVVPAWPEDAYSLLREAIRDPNPVLFFEHKYLYRRVKASLAPASIDIGAGVEAGARIVRPGDGVSVFTWGWMVHRAVAAAEALGEEGISVEVVDLRVLAPLDERTVMESVGRTGRALVVHEAQLTGGFGGEIAARIAEGAFEALDAPVRRLAYPDHPVPFNKELEAVCLPDEESIAASLRELAAW